MKLNLTFRMKIILMSVSLIILTASTIGFATLPRIREALLEDRLAELSTDIEVQGIRFTSDIEALNSEVLFMSTLPAVQGITRAIEAGGVDPIDLTTDALWRTQLAEIFSELLSSKSNYISLRYISRDNDGLELVHVTRTDDVVRVLGRRELGINVEDDYFLNAIPLENGEIYYSEITLQQNAEDTTTSVLYVSTPVYSDNGSVFGVIVIAMDVGKTFEQMNAFVGDNQNLYITNQSGNYLFNSENPESVFDVETNQSSRIQDDFTGLIPDVEAVNGELGTVTSNLSGNLALQITNVGYDPLNTERLIGITITTPASEITGEVDQFIFQAFAFSVILTSETC
ncbi:MAG: cache domain-containing protein [Chloroflexota bacterium]